MLPIVFVLASALCGSAQEALIFSGGWKGHKPHETAAYIKTRLEQKGFSVTCFDTLSCLDDADALKKYDLIIPNWTMGEILETQLRNLSEAAKAGGHFLKHPHVGPYTVNTVSTDHPVMKDVPASFEYDSEKYFMQIDAGVTISSDIDYSSVEQGLRMPAVWVKEWGTGRVFTHRWDTA